MQWSEPVVLPGRYFDIVNRRRRRRKQTSRQSNSLSPVTNAMFGKYDISRTELLPSSDQGVHGKYRQIPSSPNLSRRRLSGPLPSTTSRPRQRVRTITWVDSGKRERIPVELFNSLPESRVDPEFCGEEKDLSRFKVVGRAKKDSRRPEIAVQSGVKECQTRKEGTVFGLYRQPKPMDSDVLRISGRVIYDDTDISHPPGEDEFGELPPEEVVDNVNECYNVKINAPQRVLVEGFHDFCQTMLSIYDVARETTPTNTESKIILNKTHSDPVPAVVKETLKPRYSLPTGRIFSCTIKPTEKVRDDEAMEAIQELDASIDGVSTTENTQNSCKNSEIEDDKKPEVQTDNLIEEVVLLSSNQRSFSSFPSPALDRDKNESKPSKPVSTQNEDTSLVPTKDIITSEVPKKQVEVNGKKEKNNKLEDKTETSIVQRTSPCSVDSGNSSHHPGHFVVVAIDFGTTYSGYAFSFVRDPDNIHMMKKWEGGDPGVINQKTPTTLLLTPDKKFHSFGYSARDYYHDLDPQEAKKWLYFEKFKMALHHNEHLTLDTEIKASNGKALAAVTVFAHALRYFREHALQELSDQSATRITNDDVRWVVTVPAIWRQPAKQFMRAAAYEAGIATSEYPDQLLIALEPEAASIYCRRMRMHQLVPEIPYNQRQCANDGTQSKEIGQELTKLNNKGTKYMVVDCGGGTVDITVHELLDKQGTLRELHKATGGPYGSVGVDMEFENLLRSIFGSDFIDQFKTKRPAGFVDLMIAFEARKRNASPFKANPLNISLPFSFIDYYKRCKGTTVENTIKRYNHKHVKWSSQGMLRVEPPAMMQLFQPTLEHIKEHIANVLNSPDVNNINYLFLVGGFAESQILQKEVRDTFSPFVKVIIPQGVSLAILRGAVIFGLDPTIVNVRRLRMTYGVGVLNRFIHGIHPPEKLIVKDGIEWCADIFDKFVVTDQSVGLGDVVTRSYTPAKAGQTCSVIHIYSSERDDVHFITDPGVQRCGTLVLDLNDSKYLTNMPHRREIQMRVTFGDTEIKVSALDLVTGKCVKADIDFLNH
ncbi:heat shock 70 kDa protein 12A-like isoform X1 [Centruroides sculpturatus]|uniref:heat shock 70 kDa protein 12A-like isoform X1 n=3 Tax=Centruroides sculpturatus TaxID=218467 RepID=UPI000C6D99DB|nr:heat shock 70 kDa protein 12A-like isoform X1 [Centruroides sculpturatus]